MIVSREIGIKIGRNMFPDITEADAGRVRFVVIAMRSPKTTSDSVAEAKVGLARGGIYANLFISDFKSYNSINTHFGNDASLKRRRFRSIWITACVDFCPGHSITVWAVKD